MLSNEAITLRPNTSRALNAWVMPTFRNVLIYLMYMHSGSDVLIAFLQRHMADVWNAINTDQSAFILLRCTRLLLAQVAAPE